MSGRVEPAEAVDRPVSATARSHISAVRYAHVAQHGRYRFTAAGPPTGDADGYDPANMNRLRGGEVASPTQNRAERHGD